MSHRKIWATVVALGVVIGLVASIAPAAQTTRDAVEFLWPIGIVALLLGICLLLILDRWKARRVEPGRENANESGRESVDPLGSREKREAAYSDVLTTTEAYINAHRELATFDEPGFYVPDVEAAESTVNRANQQFVAARQAIEQYGIDPILEAVQDLEDAINRNDCDGAAAIRRDRLVPAVRQDMKAKAAGRPGRK
jgi:hypothetical protein